MFTATAVVNLITPAIGGQWKTADFNFPLPLRGMKFIPCPTPLGLDCQIQT